MVCLVANIGYSICVPVSMALLVYSGSVEFIGLMLLLSTFHPLATFNMAFMVGARHLFYGITMLDRYRGAGWKKPFLIFWMSDETFAVNFANEGKCERAVMSSLDICGCRHSGLRLLGHRQYHWLSSWA